MFLYFKDKIRKLETAKLNNGKNEWNMIFKQLSVIETQFNVFVCKSTDQFSCVNLELEANKRN